LAGTPTTRGEIVAQFLYPFLILACPLGMGLMMFMMMRGNKQDQPHTVDESELTRLRAEVDELRAAQETSGIRSTGAELPDRR
jgi:hypothetical protein